MTLTNTGSATLTIASIAVTGTNASSFVFANSCGTSLAAGANCSIHGHFDPTTGGALTAAITIRGQRGRIAAKSCADGDGTWTRRNARPSSLSYGDEKVGTASASQSVTLTNTGTATLGITSIAVTGANASSFVFANSCGTSLAAGANCTIHGHFGASGYGRADGVHHYYRQRERLHPQKVALSGTGD